MQNRRPVMNPNREVIPASGVLMPVVRNTFSSPRNKKVAISEPPCSEDHEASKTKTSSAGMAPTISTTTTTPSIVDGDHKENSPTTSTCSGEAKNSASTFYRDYDFENFRKRLQKLNIQNEPAPALKSLSKDSNVRVCSRSPSPSAKKVNHEQEWYFDSFMNSFLHSPEEEHAEDGVKDHRDDLLDTTTSQLSPTVHSGRGNNSPLSRFIQTLQG